MALDERTAVDAEKIRLLIVIGKGYIFFMTFSILHLRKLSARDHECI